MTSFGNIAQVTLLTVLIFLPVSSSSSSSVYASSEKFVIISASRSGSSYLAFLLNSHPHIITFGEIFHHRGANVNTPNKLPQPFIEAFAEERLNNPESFLQHFFTKAEETNTASSIGFKLVGLEKTKILDSLLNDTSLKKIILKRRNEVRRYISEVISKETKIWMLSKKKQLSLFKDKRETIHVNIQEMKKRIKHIDTQYAHIEAQLKKTEQPYIVIYYEEEAEGFTQESMRSLLQFLNVEEFNTPLSSKTIRQNPESMEALVSNYEELRTSLKDTELEKFIY